MGAGEGRGPSPRSARPVRAACRVPRAAPVEPRGREPFLQERERGRGRERERATRRQEGEPPLPEQLSADPLHDPEALLPRRARPPPGHRKQGAPPCVSAQVCLPFGCAETYYVCLLQRFLFEIALSDTPICKNHLLQSCPGGIHIFPQMFWNVCGLLGNMD